MAEEKQEMREEGLASVRGYLASQSMRRTPEQIVEALREAHRQLLAATKAIPEKAFRTVPAEGEWSAADVLTHVRTVAILEERAMRKVLEHGEQPVNVRDQLEQAPVDASCEVLLADIESYRERMIAVVLQADPQAHLDIVWNHSIFGAMHWREWLLFDRVHTLDHARQLQAIAAQV